jgi:hypothetical protein
VTETRRGFLRWGGAATLALAGLGRTRARAQAGPSRQVTLFGVAALPNDPTIDPKLAQVAPHLRRLLPGHGFRLLGVKNQRLEPGQSLTCDLTGGWVATIGLVDPLDSNGKVQLHFGLDHDGAAQLSTDVLTPPNQLFFCDKTFPDHSRLLIGIGAR